MWDLALQGGWAQGDSPSLQQALESHKVETGHGLRDTSSSPHLATCSASVGMSLPSLVLVPPFCSWGLEQPPKELLVLSF